MSFQYLTRTIFITASISLASLPPALAQTTPQSIVESWVKSADSVKFLTVTHNGIDFDAASKITTISDLSIHLEIDSGKMNVTAGSVTRKAEGKVDYIVTFPKISFDNLQLANGYYAARSIRADIGNLQLDITGNPSASSTARGTYKDLNIDNIRWAKLPDVADDPSKPISRYYPLIEAMTDISFDRASTGAITLDQSTGQPAINMRLTYGASTYGRAERGKFTDMKIAGIQMVMSASDDTPAESKAAMDATISFGDATIDQYDFRALVEVFKPGSIATTDNDPFKSVIGAVVMDGIKVSAAGGSFSMDEFSILEWGVRPPKNPVLEQADQLFIAAQSGEKPDEKEIIKLVAGVYGSFRLGEFSLAGMKFSAPGEVQGKLDLYRISDLSANGLGEFAVKGVNFKGNKGEYVNLDLFSLADIKFPPLEALLNLEEAGKKNDVLAIMKAIPTLGSYITRGLEVRIPGQGEFALAEGKMKMAGFIGPVPTDVDVLVRDLKIPVKLLDREQRQILGAMGFDNLQLSYGLKALWDEATSVLSMNTNAHLVDGGALDVDVSVGGIPRSVFENPLTAQSLVALVTVNSASVVFDDQSIVDKGLKVVAAQQGTDPETLKAQAVGLLPFMLQILNKPAFVNEVSAAVKTFLDSKGKISASATPAAPVSVIQLIGVGSTAPGAVIDLLNIKVKAE